MPAPEELLQIQSHIDGVVGELSLQGQLIAETRYEVEGVLREWIQHDLSCLIIRCARLTHIDSGGLSLLMGWRHRFQEKGGGLVLTELTSSIQALFATSALDRFFDTFPTIDAARAHFDTDTTET